MPYHSEIYQQAVDAIRELFEDRSVPDAVIDEDAQRLIDDIELLRSLLTPSSSENGEGNASKA